MPDRFDDTGFLLRSLMDNISDKIYFKDRESRFVMLNKTCMKWHGFTSEKDYAGKTDFDVFTKEHAQQAFDDEQRIIATGEPLLGVEERETWEDGTVTWVSTTKMPLRDKNGQIIGTFGISRDITEQKEAQLKASQYAAEIMRINEAMEDDVRMAGELQKTFFPKGYPDFPEGAEAASLLIEFHHHYFAGGILGGDYCAVTKLSEHEAGVFLCDVMGHGVRAALGTAFVRAMVEEISAIENDPGRFLTHMNRVLLPILQQEDVLLFTTACYLVVDVADGSVRAASAGHPLPMYFSGADGSVRWLFEDRSWCGPALALCEGEDYPTIQIEMLPGDAIVMFTDGLFEVAGANRDELGEQRLLEIARRHARLALPNRFTAILDDARQFSSKGTFEDDVCLIGFRLKATMP